MPKEPRGCISPIFTDVNGASVDPDLSLLCSVVIGKELDKLKKNDLFNRMASSNSRKSTFQMIKKKIALLEHFKKRARAASFENLPWFEQTYGVSITIWWKTENDVSVIYDGCGSGIKVNLMTKARNSLR